MSDVEKLTEAFREACREYSLRPSHKAMDAVYDARNALVAAAAKDLTDSVE